jgi:nucleoside-diphosphate kinase
MMNTHEKQLEAIEKAEQEFEDLIQKTLVLFKPDAVQRGIVGEILQRFERVGLKIVATKMAAPDENHFREHYEGIGALLTRHGENTFQGTLVFMQSGPVIAMVLEGVEAVSVVRKLVGGTEPRSADMGTIRGDFSHVSYGYADSKHIGIANLIHASATPKEAKQEIALWFKPEELYDYNAPIEKYTR